MKANNRFSIAFIVRLSKKDKTKGLLYARVAVNGEYTEVSLKELVALDCWDPAREEVKGKTAHAKALNPGAGRKTRANNRSTFFNGSARANGCIFGWHSGLQ